MILPFGLFFLLDYWTKNMSGTMENTDNNTGSDTNNQIGNLVQKYGDKNVSQWALSHLKKSEGLWYKADYVNSAERLAGQLTIGYGTSYLYKTDGTSFPNGYKNNGVKVGDTLSSLKVRMGYNSLDDKIFAEQLIKNHLYSNASSYKYFVGLFDGLKLPYLQRLKDAIQDWSYTSGSIGKIVPSKRTNEINSLVNAMKTTDYNAIASAYVLLRYSYYRFHTGAQAWSISKIGWLIRILEMGYYVKTGNNIDGAREIGYNSAQRQRNLRNLEAAYKKYFGLVVSFGT